MTRKRELFAKIDELAAECRRLDLELREIKRNRSEAAKRGAQTRRARASSLSGVNESDLSTPSP